MRGFFSCTCNTNYLSVFFNMLLFCCLSLHRILLEWITPCVADENMHSTAISHWLLHGIVLSVFPSWSLKQRYFFFNCHECAHAGDLRCISCSWCHHVDIQAFFCPMETQDDSRMSHPSQFKALLPCYRKQMGFHHIGTQYQ